MELKYKNGDNVADSVGLLISILVRYPEVGTINYEPGSQNLKFNFMLSKIIPKNNFDKFKSKVVSCLDTFNYLEGRIPQSIILRHAQSGGLTVLQVIRDVGTLTHEEIDLITKLIHQEFPNNLVTDDNVSLLEEELLVQEELIGHMLENVKDCIPQKKLIAFRENGRVLVFNK